MARKEDLLAMLRARTNHEGKPRPGYASNVAAIRAELEQMQAAEKKEGGE